MSQIMKAFTGVFIVLFIMATGTGILGAFIQTLQAQDLHGKIIDELENSDYALSVIRENFQIVEEYGLQLEVLLYLEDGSVITCHNASEVPASMAAVTMAEVALAYPVRIPFVGLDRSHQLVGYAR